MRYFLPKPVDDSEFLQAATPAGDRFVRRLLKDELDHRWRPVGVRVVAEESGRRLKPSHFPWYRHELLVLRPRARTACAGIVETAGRFLPLEDVAGDELSLVHVPTVDALDPEGSDVFRSSDGWILTLRRLCLRKSVVGTSPLIRCKHPDDFLVVSEEFVEAVIDNDLDGLEFESKVDVV